MIEKDSVSKALRRVLNPAHFVSLVRRAFSCVAAQGFLGLWRAICFRVDLMLGRETWRYRIDAPLPRELKAQRETRFEHAPRISICVPVYNTPPKYLRQLVKSVRKQTYSNWQLVLADASDSVHPAPRLPKDERIVHFKLPENKGIAGNTNAALARAGGDYIALLDHDDVLPETALFEVARAVTVEGADFVYTDEIVLDESLKQIGVCHYKPDFSPDSLRGCNYITHLSVFSRALLEQAGGGERSEFDGAQDFDLILRLTEKASKIVHIPKVLYWWRAGTGSTAGGMEAKPHAVEAGRRAVAAHLERVGLAGSVEAIEGCPGAYRTRYEITRPGLVSVLIPNKDHADDLARCVESIEKNAGWDDLEILLIENNSEERETFSLYETLQQKYKNCRVLTYTGGFNFSAINNFGAQQARGEYLLLLNNDVELETPGFVREMLSYAQRPDVGAVGAKLFYPDGTVQHGGVFIGLGGSAGHSHKGHLRESPGDMYRLATAQNFCAVTGACLMVKKSLYDAFGGLDAERFAVAYNDVDFCLRLWRAGYLNVMTPFATATHYESKSRGDDTHSGGAKQARYEAEREAFRASCADLLTDGDPYYNPHLTLLYENYGFK